MRPLPPHAQCAVFAWLASENIAATPLERPASSGFSLKDNKPLHNEAGTKDFGSEVERPSLREPSARARAQFGRRAIARGGPSMYGTGQTWSSHIGHTVP